MGPITVTSTMTREEQRRALDGSLLQGFRCEAASYPVTRIGASVVLPDGVALSNNDISDPVEAAASAHARPIPDMDWRPRKGLEALFSPGVFLLDEDHDQLADAVNLRFRLPESPSAEVMVAACDLAHRIGQETTGFTGSLLWEESWAGPVVVFTGAGACQLSLEGEEGITISGDGAELIRVMSLVCNSFPLLSAARTWTWQLQAMTDSLAGRDLDGQLAWLAAHGETDGRYQVYTEPGFSTRVPGLQDRFPQVEFIDYKGKVLRWEKSFVLAWEVDQFLAALRSQVYPRVSPGDLVEIRGRLSEDLTTRRALAERIRQELRELGAGRSDVGILCAYKQGYSWLTEEVLPELMAVDARTVTIGFVPFLAPGITDWGDVDGAVPSYNTMGGASRDHWLDLPIRWLQELYPVQDALTEALELPRSAITFEQLDRSDVTYEVSARNGQGEVVLRREFTASWSERPYLDAYPEAGLVHPATGRLEARINGVPVLDVAIVTDLEAVWDIYQREILPAVGESLLAKGESLRASDQPFFAELELDLTLSEPDETLPYRQDLFSSLDALHEDLYFVGSDYFKFLGSSVGETIDAAGLILPRIRRGTGRPALRVARFDPIARAPRIDRIGSSSSNGTSTGEHEPFAGETRCVMTPGDRRAIRLWIRRLALSGTGLSVTLATDLDDPGLLTAYAALLEEGLLDAGHYLPQGEVILSGPGSEARARIRRAEEDVPELTAEELAALDLGENVVIGYDQCQEILSQLSRHPDLSVYPIARSYQGRLIQAVEFKPRGDGYVSRTKRLTRYPSLYINARHHANEVSSTNAAFLLIRRLLADPEFQDLARRMNLVIVPMENPDGTEIHYELQKANPRWKLHVARFNAIGKEFYRDHFDPDTIHTEAMGLTRLWQHMLPDVMVDNHGVPSHEWEQQFSGYTSPAFKGFWIPRSLLYGYFWYVTDPIYGANAALNQSMEGIIAKAMLGDPEITALNLEWKEVFETYAHRWMPRLFPADYYKNMINYWIPFAHDPLHRYPSIRFPWITSVAYTSEVADETAQGEYLALCARAHLRHDLAMIRALLSARLPMERVMRVDETGMIVKERRLRPLQIPTGSDAE